MGNSNSVQCSLCIPGADEDTSDIESESINNNDIRHDMITDDNFSDDSDGSLYEDIIKIKKQIAKEKKKRRVLKERARQERIKRKELQKNFDEELKSTITSPKMDDMVDTNSNYTATMLSGYNTGKTHTHTHSRQSTHDSIVNDGHTPGMYNEVQYTVPDDGSIHSQSNTGSIYNNPPNIVVSKPQIVAQTSQPLPPLMQNNDDIVTHIALPQIPVSTGLTLPTNNNHNHISVVNTPSGPVVLQNTGYLNIVPSNDEMSFNETTPRGSLVYQFTPQLTPSVPSMSQRPSIVSVHSQMQQLQPQPQMQQSMPNVIHRPSNASSIPPPMHQIEQQIQPPMSNTVQPINNITPNNNIKQKLSINVTDAPPMTNMVSDTVATPMEDLQLKINTLGQDQNAMNRALIRMKMMEMGISTEDIFNTMIHNEDTKSKKSRLTNDVSYAETIDTESSMSQRDLDEIEQYKKQHTLKKLNIDE